MSYKIIKKGLDVADVGDVVGPASSTDNALARFDGTTGELLQDSTITVTDDGEVIIDGTGVGASNFPLTITTLDASASNEKRGLLITDTNGVSASATFVSEISLDTNDDAPKYLGFRNSNGEGYFGMNSNASMSMGTSVASVLDFYPNNTLALTLDAAATVIIENALDLNSNVISDVADPAADQDAATRNYVDTPIAMNAAGNSGTTITLDFDRMITQAVTMTDNCTFTFDNPSSGGTYLVKLTQGGAGSFTATWPASVKWVGGAAPTLTTAVGAIDIVTFFYDGTNYFGNAGLAYA